MEKNEYLDVSAEFVGAAALFASNDDRGGTFCHVNIIPGPVGGAIIWALDGHHAFFIHEEDGVVTEPVQIRHHKDLLKACGCKVDAPKKRLQAEHELEYIRVASFDKKDGEQFIDFNPAPAHRARDMINYKSFVEKFAVSIPGVRAKSINGNTYALMRKLFKDEYKYHPILHQSSDESGEGPVFHTFSDVPNMLVTTMPVKVFENCDGKGVPQPGDSYADFLNIASTLVSSPFAEG